MKYICDTLKVRPTENLHSLIATQDCASFSVRLLIALNMLSWVRRRPGPVFKENTPIIRMVYSEDGVRIQMTPIV